MELRSCHHLHFISAIKNGEVVKTMNVIMGKPVLSFKKINELEDLNGTFVCSPSYPIPVVSRSLHGAFESGCNNHIVIDSEEGNHDAHDAILGEMTLKQLKEKCRAKKRKASASLESSKGNTERYTFVKQEFSELPSEDVDNDLKMTLCSLKCKVSKKSKSTKKYKHAPVPRTTVAKSEPVSYNYGLLQSCLSTNNHTGLGAKVSSPDQGVKQVLTSSPDCSSSDEIYDEGLYDGEVTCEVSRMEDVSSPKGPLTSSKRCEASHTKEHIMVFVDTTLPLESSKGEEILNLDNPENSSEKGTSAVLDSGVCSSLTEENLDNPEISATGTSFLLDSGESSQVRIYSQDVDKYRRPTEDLAFSPEKSMCEGVTKGNNAPITTDQLASSPVKDENIADLLTCKESPESVFPLCHSSSCCTDHKIDSVQLGSPMANDRCSKGLSSCVGSTISTQLMQPSNPLMAESMEHVVPYSIGEIVDEHIDNDDYVTSIAEENKTSKRDDHPCNDAMETSDSIVTENQESLKLHHPPEKLFSARKSISPTSQEKLCKAMISIKLFSNSPSKKCQEKLCFEEDNKNTVSPASLDLGDDRVITSPKRSNHVKAANISCSSEQRIKKGKDDKKSAHLKGYSMATHPSQVTRVTSCCTTVQSCSQSAVAFSQQQMHDIERLTGKLTNELRSMRETIVEAFFPDARFASSSRYDVNEVRIAVENAAKVEETAKKWLSIMTRDCNRFCKIMSLAEKEASSSPGSKTSMEKAEADVSGCSINATLNGRKKITFADENGGRLCDIRVFDDQLSYL